MPHRSTFLLSAAAALVLSAAGCAATWEGLKRDSEGLFGEGTGVEDAVGEAQRLLNEKGYDAGPADGLMGPRTTRAVLSYQADHGLRRTGHVDDELLTSLREEAAPRRAQSSPPPTEEDWVDPY